MININVQAGQFCEVVDVNTFHLETSEGILLINIDLYTINDIIFSTSQDAVNYILYVC
jgi:hypothetical protein